MDHNLEPAAKKAYEVSYALFRVAAILPSRPFAELLEKEALQLLRLTIGNNLSEAQGTLQELHYLVSFGKDTGNIHPGNGDLLIRQMESLGALMIDSINKNKSEPGLVDLNDIFTSGFLTESPKRSAAGEPRNEPKIVSTNTATPSVTILGDRQSLILDKIRQSGNCRTRDIQAILPDLSERTLRYDLQRLVEQGKIERGGGGGPTSWYRIKEASTMPGPSLVAGT